MGSLVRLLPHRPRSYMLCAVARSGSNLLADGLVQVRRAGRLGQYFLPQNETRTALDHGLAASGDFAAYVRGVVAATSTANGVFGFKIMGWYLEKFLARLRAAFAGSAHEKSELETLCQVFPLLQFVQISRRNKVRQAISKARALQTGVWKIQDGKKPMSEARFDSELIARCLRDLHEEEKIWQDFFQRIEVAPFSVVYEELCRDYEQTIRSVLDFLHIRLPRRIKISPPVTVSQSDATSRAWEEQFLTLSSADQNALQLLHV